MGKTLDSSTNTIAPLPKYRQDLYELLWSRNISASEAYLGAIRVLEDVTNPDRISQSANSLREVTNLLAREVDDYLKESKVSDINEIINIKTIELEQAKDEKDKNIILNNAIALIKERVNLKEDKKDLVRKIAEISPGDDDIPSIFHEQWQDFHNFFVSICHHGRFPTPQEFESKLTEFENLLHYFFFTKPSESLNEIDILLTKDPELLTKEDIYKINVLASKSKKYFFNNAPENWFEVIEKLKFFKNIPKNFVKADKSRSFPYWTPMIYLKRVAGTSPRKVSRVMKTINLTPSKNISLEVKKDFIELIGSLELEDIKFMISKINSENLLGTEFFSYIDHTFLILVKALVKRQFWGSIKELSKLLLKPIGVDKNTEDITSYLDEYNYKEFLDQLILVPPEKSKWIILDVLLPYMVQSEQLTLGSKDYLMGSETWRPVIQDSENNWNFDRVKEHLLVSLRDKISAYIKYYLENKNYTQIDTIVTKINDFNDIEIIYRLKLELFNQFSEYFKQDIINTFNKPSFCVEGIYEEEVLLQNQFKLLTEKQKANFIDRTVNLEDDEADLKNKYTKIRILGILSDYLEESERKILKELTGEDNYRRVPEPGIRHGGSFFRGPVSPTGVEEMRRMDIESLFDSIVSFKPSANDFNEAGFTPSHEGFARELGSYVREVPELFLNNINKLKIKSLRPTYIFNILFGLRGSINVKPFNWKELIEFFLEITEIYIEGKHTVNNQFSSNESNYESIYKEMLSIIENGLNSNRIPKKYKTNVFFIINTFILHPDPSREEEIESGGKNMDYYTMSINTVRGQDFHALFEYLVWINRGKNKINVEIPYEIKMILERHSAELLEKRNTILSVYGRYIQLLLFYDQKWTINLLNNLFPKDNKAIWDVVLETFLTTTPSYLGYKELKDIYSTSIIRINELTVSRIHWSDSTQLLTEHVVIAYLFETPNNELYYSLFLKHATIKLKKHFVNFIGRSYIEGWGKSEQKYRVKLLRNMKRLWENLLVNGSIHELEPIGWWIKKDVFDNEWMLLKLNETLIITKGNIDADYVVVETLTELANDYSELVAKCFKQLVTREEGGNFLISKNDIEPLTKLLLHCSSPQAIMIANEIKEFMIERNNLEFRNL